MTLTRMNTDLSGLRQDLSDLKQNYIKLESELSAARQVNNKLKEHIVWSNSQYSRWECLEITGIPDKTDQTDLENTALNIFRKLDVETLRIVSDYRPRGPNVHLLNSQNEKMQTESAIARKIWREWTWPHLVFLLQYLLTTASASITRCFGANAKNLLTNKFSDSFWVSNGFIRLRVENKDRPCVITHFNDLEALFPGNDILRDEE